MPLSDHGRVPTMVVQRPDSFWREAAAAEQYEAGRFNSVWGRVYRTCEESAVGKALRMLEPGTTILDAACGTGRITGLVTRHGFRARGCDISFEMMSVARRHRAALAPSGVLVQCEAGALPFRDASFDAVSCIGLLMHLDAPARAQVLRELARVSRQWLILQYGRPGLLQRTKASLTGRPAGGVQHPLDEAELRADQQRAGLTELARFWVLRPLSTSVILVLSNRANVTARALAA